MYGGEYADYLIWNSMHDIGAGRYAFEEFQFDILSTDSDSGVDPSSPAPTEPSFCRRLSGIVVRSGCP